MLNLKQIEAARVRIQENIRLTPVVPWIEALGEATTFLKLENMQRTGSFKDRGAVNKLTLLKEREGARGVIAASAGNHAQAVAFHGTRLGFDVTIVMPEFTPLNKILATQKFGAKTVLEGPTFDAAMAYAKERSIAEKRVFLHAFDDAEVVAGQGTAALELLEQVPDLQWVVIPVGGGGLASGMALALKEKKPGIRVIGVQTENYPHSYRAFHGMGEQAPSNPPPATIGDGIAMKMVGGVTLPILRKYLDDLITVSEDEMARAVLALLESSKVLSEGSGAAALAAVRSGRATGLKGPGVAMVSGGNIDVTLIARIIEKGLVGSGRLARLDVIIPDRPGGLRGLAALIAELRANILQIQHERASQRVPLYATNTELTLETRSPEHIEEIVKKLRAEGYTVEPRR